MSMQVRWVKGTMCRHMGGGVSSFKLKVECNVQSPRTDCCHKKKKVETSVSDVITECRKCRVGWGSGDFHNKIETYTCHGNLGVVRTIWNMWNRGVVL